MAEYESVIGLEVHVQLKTRSKLFCGCPAEFGAEPNFNTCPVCLGLPGSLPVLNEQAFLYGIQIALALNCRVAERLKFDRKNYFYPDLPKAYQISQYDQPLSCGGHLLVDMKEGQRKIGITRAHMEEDAGKLLHEGRTGSVIDYNRAGVPLMEIVSEPDIRTPEEAYAYLTALKAILQYIGVSDCDMEKGSLRCDANVSIRLRGETKLGTKVEIKNLNSFNAVKRALQYEIARQTDAAVKGEAIYQETRLWNDEKEMTLTMRSKEEAHDYRYFPEPDLVPFTVSSDLVEDLREDLPELPAVRKERFVKDFGLSEYDASVLIQDKALGNFFEECVTAGAPPKRASNLIQSELLGMIYERGETFHTMKTTAVAVADLIRLVENGTVSGRGAKDVLAGMLETGNPAEDIVREKGLAQVSDESVIAEAAKKVIAANPKPVEDYKNGKEKSFAFLVGQMMRETKGKANPALANKVLRELLGKL